MAITRISTQFSLARCGFATSAISELACVKGILNSSLPIGLARSMLSEIVTIQEVLRHPGALSVEARGVERHTGHTLKNDGSVRGIRRGPPPAERGVASDQDRWYRERIQPLEPPGNCGARIQHVVPFDFIPGKLLRHRHGSIEVVGMGSAIGRYLSAGLGPRGRKLRVCVHYGSYLAKHTV